MDSKIGNAKPRVFVCRDAHQGWCLVTLAKLKRTERPSKFNVMGNGEITLQQLSRDYGRAASDATSLHVFCCLHVAAGRFGHCVRL